MRPHLFNILLLLLSASLILLPVNVDAVGQFTAEELEKLEAKIQMISDDEDAKREKEAIWAEMKKKLLFGDEKGLDFRPHKLNYFITNGLPGDPDAQIKFQISAKYGGIGTAEFRKYLPLYFSYTQKSFWNIGKPSAPFEENNYNPEVFLDYQVKGSGIYLDHLVIGGEHESNGRDGAESRSWNRLYLQFSFGIEAGDGLEKKGVLRKEKYAAYLKLWEAYGEEYQDDYLKSIGRSETFLDYAGRGEIGFSIRELPIISYFRVLKNNQLDFRTRIFRDWDKGSMEIGYHQNIPTTNFFLYLQYWDGYGESLQRFSVRDTKWKGGLSFFF